MGVIVGMGIGQQAFAQGRPGDVGGVPPDAQSSSVTKPPADPASSSIPSDGGTASSEAAVASSEQASSPPPASSSVAPLIASSSRAAAQSSSVMKPSSAAASSVAKPSSAPHPSSAALAKRSSSRASAITMPFEAAASSSHSAIDLVPLSYTGAAATPSPSLFDRDWLGYHVPVIDPAVIKDPAHVSLDPAAILTNLLIAILFTLVLGLAAALLQHLIAAHPSYMERFLRRLPYQLVLTIALIALARFLVPAVSAQMIGNDAGASLLRLPFFAFLFFLVVGVSNALFNALLTAAGPAVNDLLRGHRDLHRALWFVAVLVLLYGLVGAHINPFFSLLPPQNPGIIIVAVVTIIAGTYASDAARYAIARKWRCPAWFEANVAGLAVALLCVAVSREFTLNPGFIYGLPVGLFLALQHTRRHEGALQSLSLTWMIAIAALVWLLIPGLWGYQIPSDIGNLLFVILIEGAFFEMLPLPAFAGQSIFRWSRALWALLSTVTVFFLFHTLFNPQGTVAGIVESPPAFASILLLGCFAAGTALLWAYVAFIRARR